MASAQCTAMWSGQTATATGGPHTPRSSPSGATVDRLSQPTICPKVRYIFHAEKPSTETTAAPRWHLAFLTSRRNMNRLLWQCMVLPRRQGICLKSRTQITCTSMVIHILLLQKCQLWREIHKKEPEHGQVPAGCSNIQ